MGATLNVVATASDPDGNLREHWLEVRRPAGDWSWQGWLTGEPWGPALGGDSFASTKSGALTFASIGTYIVRSTALNADGLWTISEEIPITVIDSAPRVTLMSPGSQTVTLGATLTISGVANDPGGNLSQHWLEIKRPEGDWSWQGWLTGEPWGPALGGNSFTSSKSGTFTFTTAGTYVARSTALNADGFWTISQEISITVVNTLPTVTLTAPDAQTIMVGSTLTISGMATDPDGNLSQHWLEIKRPAGDWSWQGWLTGAAWDGSLAGDGFSSSKSASFTFNDLGFYIVRTTAVDASGNWQISPDTVINVIENL